MILIIDCRTLFWKKERGREGKRKWVEGPITVFGKVIFGGVNGVGYPLPGSAGERCIALPSEGLVWSWVRTAVYLKENCMSQTNVQSPMKDVVIPEPTWAKSDLSRKPEWEFPQEVERGAFHVDTTQENRGILESRPRSPCLSHGDVKWQESFMITGVWCVIICERLGCHVVLEAVGSKQRFRKQDCPSCVEMDTYVT